MAVMANLTVKLPDGTPLSSTRGRAAPTRPRRSARGLAKAALAVKVDGEVRDLAAPLADGEAI